MTGLEFAVQYLHNWHKAVPQCVQQAYVSSQGIILNFAKPIFSAYVGGPTVGSIILNSSAVCVASNRTSKDKLCNGSSDAGVFVMCSCNTLCSSSLHCKPVWACWNGLSRIRCQASCISTNAMQPTAISRHAAVLATTLRLDSGPHLVCNMFETNRMHSAGRTHALHS